MKSVESLPAGAEPASGTPVSPPFAHVPLTHRMGAKITAFVLGLLFLFVFCLSAVGALWMLDENLYSLPQETYLDEQRRDLAEQDALRFAQMAVYRWGENEINAQFLRKNLLYIRIENPESGEVFLNLGSETEKGDRYTFDLTLYKERLVYFEGTSQEEIDYAYWVEYGEAGETEGESPLLATVTVSPVTACGDKIDGYALLSFFVPVAYALRFWIYVIALSAIFLAFLCLIFLFCSAGRRKDAPGIRPGIGTRIPWDLLLAALVLGGILLLQLLIDGFGDYFLLLLPFAVCLYAIPLVEFLLSVALRIKLRCLWKTSAVGFFCRQLLRLGRATVRGIVSLWKTFLRLIPFVWKILLLYFGISFVQLVLLLLWQSGGDVILLFLLERICVFPLLCYVLWVLLRLKNGAEELRRGELDTPIDTTGMIGVFRAHGECLNSLGEGLGVALEERVKSERMKTELITNVSHDLKTPLTSVINYADLIAKEPNDNPKITQYAEVLSRQSVRLKRLIDDLVEVSKANSGTMDVQIEKLDVGVLLLQMEGEYEERLAQQNLLLRVHRPDEPVYIAADGRRLWRVFDNLMNNICKYAQSGTRVYLSLETEGSEAVITFRNISAQPLELPEEELFERFTRGDAARHSEGSGLGLSIARSLTELQKGSLRLHLDGDLFKAILRFPLCGEEREEETT